jgi:hypothetical protein
LATLEAWLVWQSAAYFLRWRPVLNHEEVEKEREDVIRQEACQLASLEYFPHVFPLASYLWPHNDPEILWLAERMDDLRSQLIALNIPDEWATLLAEAEPVFSANSVVGTRVNVNNSSSLTDEPFLQMLIAAEKAPRPDPQDIFMADFLRNTLQNIEMVWLENRFYRLYLAVRLRVSFLRDRVAASEFSVFSQMITEERNYADLVMGLTRDLINGSEREKAVEETMNIEHFGPLSTLEQFFLIVGSEACQTGKEAVLELVKDQLRCDD